MTDITNASFENILLRKLVVSSDFFSKVSGIIQAKYFQNQGNVEVFKLLKSHYLTYQKIPTMVELATSIKNIPNVELRAQIANSLKNISTIDVVQNDEFLLNETVSFIKDSIFTEALILGSDGITQKSEAKKLQAKMLIEEMTKVSVDSDLGLDFDNVELMIEYYQNKLIGVTTQHAEFNKRLGHGFLPGTLSVIMAASGIGKSLLMTDLITGHIRDRKNVLLVSMEMEDKEIMKRVHANILDLPINDLKNIDPLVIRQAHERIKNSGVGKFYVKDFPNGTFSPLMLDALLDNYKNEMGIEFDIVYLDYLGIMKSDLITPAAGLYSYVKSIVEETRAIAKKRKTPIVSASQLNRGAVNNTDADNSAVSDSIGTVQTADFIVFLLQTDTMKEANLITCKCTKNRFTGRTDKWDMCIDYTHMRFSDAVVQNSGLDEREIKKIITENDINDLKIIQKHDSMMSEDFSEKQRHETQETQVNATFDVASFLGI